MAIDFDAFSEDSRSELAGEHDHGCGQRAAGRVEMQVGPDLAVEFDDLRPRLQVGRNEA